MEDKISEICFEVFLPNDLPAHEARWAGPPPDNMLDAGAFRMAVLFAKEWENGKTIKVSFMEGDPGVHRKVEEIAHTWSEHANIAFDFGDHDDAEIRIAFQPALGSWSFLGIDALGIEKDRMTMNFGWLRPGVRDEVYHRVVLHEFGHALGAIHEHQNPSGRGGIPWDKEKVYEKYAGPPNNWSRQKVDNNLFKKFDQSVTQFTDFDSKSIMLYPIPNALTIGDWEVGLNSALSTTDREFIATRYRRDVKDPNELAIGAEPTETEIGMHGEEDDFWFQVTKAAEYVVETHGSTDVVMALYGPDDGGRKIAQDDDTGRGLNAKITALLEPGRYDVRVWHYWPTKTGSYAVDVRELTG